MKESLKTVSNCKLLRGLNELVTKGRQNEAGLLAYLAEVDKRQLYLGMACSSMHRYCTTMLHFSEGMAYHRIAVARASCRYPLLLERIREGALHLAGAYLLASKLTPQNQVELLDLARHRTKRAIEVLLADRAPKPDVPAQIRQLPDPRPASIRMPSETNELTHEAQRRDAALSAPVPRAPSSAPSPLGGRRFKVQFTGSQALCDKLREAQALLRHQILDGDLAEIFDRALTLLLEDTKRKKFAQTSRPRKQKSARKSGSASRHIPAQTKRAVVARDGGRCAFIGRNGRRCISRDLLEFHHREPWARAKLHSIGRIELRCRGHNHYAALQDYGAAYMARFAGRDNCTRVQSDVEREGRRNPDAI